ncbi:unnamed protein product, partial [marine sediment metagenome]
PKDYVPKMAKNRDPKNSTKYITTVKIYYSDETVKYHREMRNHPDYDPTYGLDDVMQDVTMERVKSASTLRKEQAESIAKAKARRKTYGDNQDFHGPVKKHK